MPALEPPAHCNNLSTAWCYYERTWGEPPRPDLARLRVQRRVVEFAGDVWRAPGGRSRGGWLDAWVAVAERSSSGVGGGSGGVRPRSALAVVAAAAATAAAAAVVVAPEPL